MENATRALLIAAGVLIAIIILAIGVALYVMFSGQSKSFNTLISEIEVDKFNSNFNVFIGKSKISPEDIISIVNKAKEYHNQITVLVFKNSSTVPIDTSDAEEFMKEYIDTTFHNDSSATEYDINGKIVKIKFIANN